MKEKETAIRSGLLELRQHGYLFQNRYRDKKTKQIKGTFWACTNIPHQFEDMGNMGNIAKILTDNNWELFPENIQFYNN